MAQNTDPQNTQKTPTVEIGEQFTGVLSTLSSFRSQITQLQNQVRGLEKAVNRQMKVYMREAKKNKNKGNRKPSGFAVPTAITEKLCEFMKVEPGTEVARTEVTKYIIKYIKDNDLQWEANRKVIKPDSALRELLEVGTNDEVTYFNLQRYMNKHFKRKGAASAAAAAAAAASS